MGQAMKGYEMPLKGEHRFQKERSSKHLKSLLLKVHFVISNYTKSREFSCKKIKNRSVDFFQVGPPGVQKYK